MTTFRSPKPTTRPGLPLIAATTAALPAVVLSSLAIAQPASAEPRPRAIPATLAAAMKAQAQGSTARSLPSALIPAGSVSSAIPAEFRPAKVAAPAEYTIARGDTISAVAGKFGLGTFEVLKLNNLRANTLIYPGQKIKLTASASGSYTIKAGDTLSGIAARHSVKLADILSANRLTMSSIIYPGNKLVIPGATTGSVNPTSSQPPATVTPLVPSTFLGFSYPAAVVSSANQNKALLNAAPVPSPEQMKQIVADTARRMGVDPSLAMAFAFQESSFNHRSVSPANAIGTMQVIPSSGQWASDLVGRKLNLLDPYDNATAGVAIIRQLVRTSKDLDTAIAGYYQGQYSVSKYGMYDDTKAYVASIKRLQKQFS